MGTLYQPWFWVVFYLFTLYTVYHIMNWTNHKVEIIAYSLTGIVLNPHTSHPTTHIPYSVFFLADMQILPDCPEGPDWELFFRVFSGLGFVKVSYSVLFWHISAISEDQIFYNMWLLKCQNMALWRLLNTEISKLDPPGWLTLPPRPPAD